MFQKSFVRFKNGYVVTFDTLIVEIVYQSPIQLPPRKKPPPSLPRKGRKNSFRPPSRNLIRIIRSRSRIKSGMRFFSQPPQPHGAQTPHGG